MNSSSIRDFAGMFNIYLFLTFIPCRFEYPEEKRETVYRKAPLRAGQCFFYCDCHSVIKVS